VPLLGDSGAVVLGVEAVLEELEAVRPRRAVLRDDAVRRSLGGALRRLDGETGVLALETGRSQVGNSGFVVDGRNVYLVLERNGHTPDSFTDLS